ncbi:hypothetical protein TIFTF001_032310 [Ficus carica]|uniref:Uncharacterized protein n=1 Tax=Ficus carica TaxID=3494 RepID=A0AA88DX80_FICCA|nr:hypothetical protein TIFTF001_032310 [Ficus carica]
MPPLEKASSSPEKKTNSATGTIGNVGAVCHCLSLTELRRGRDRRGSVGIHMPEDWGRGCELLVEITKLQEISTFGGGAEPSSVTSDSEATKPATVTMDSDRR